MPIYYTPSYIADYSLKKNIHTMNNYLSLELTRFFPVIQYHRMVLLTSRCGPWTYLSVQGDLMYIISILRKSSDLNFIIYRQTSGLADIH